MQAQGPDDKHQLLLLALLCLLGRATESIATVLVGQSVDKGGVGSGPAWPTSPTRISRPSSLAQEEEHHLPVLLYLLWLPGFPSVHTCMLLSTLVMPTETAMPENMLLYVEERWQGEPGKTPRAASRLQGCHSDHGRPQAITPSPPHPERSTESTTAPCSFHC